MLLKVNNLSKHFSVKSGTFQIGKRVVKAVDDVSFSMKTGENLSLVGESGCGKTTLARMIARLIQPTKGGFSFEEVEVSKMSKDGFKRFRKNVQVVFQDPYSSLDPRFRIRDILFEGFTLDEGKYPTESEREIRMHELLKAVNLSGDILSRYPHEFSGGERQRIAIARALILHPKLLILDEAVSSLDVLIQQQIIDLLKNIQRRFDLTYLFITHNLKVARKISDKIAVMYQGKVVELGQTEEILTNPLHLYTKDLLSAALDYKCVERPEPISLPNKASLVEQAKGHFVLQEA